MDAQKQHALDHLKKTLEPFGLHDLADVCERFFQSYGDATVGLHPASILAHTHDLIQQPLGGEDGFGDLQWQIFSPQGLPQVRVDLELHMESKDYFLTNAPFTGPKVERDFYTSRDPENEDDSIYQYLIEDLDDEDRDNTFASIADDCQAYAYSYIDSLKIKGWEGWSAVLRDAAERGNVEAVGDALSIGIPVHGTDAHGNSALHLAASNGHGPVLTPLLNAGADPNARNADGRSPLHLAATNKWAVACLTLMAHGADPGIKDNRGKIPSARDHVQVFSPSL